MAPSQLNVEHCETLRYEYETLGIRGETPGVYDALVYVSETSEE